tara:strand:+ start:8684 stop:9334 length:651 start_codon:yes stop_codon:yes gene_type:complete
LDKTHLSKRCFRLIPSHYPPIQLFENLLDPDELEAAYYLESLTNDRLRDEVGDIALVSPEDRVTGPGTSAIMAAFTHTGIASRFSSGNYGVYYAGLTLDTALAESRHSRERFLSDTDEEALVLTMRCYECRVDAELVDLRGDEACHQEEWGNAQAQGLLIKTQDELGILYRSVRHTGGENIAILRPPALIPPANQTKHYHYHWNGQEITHVSEINS